MYEYHFRSKAKKNQLSESNIDASQILSFTMKNSMFSDTILSKKSKSVVTPFLQKRNHQFVSPLTALISQRSLILDPNISQTDLKEAIGSL